MKLIALKHLRRRGGGPRIEKGSEFLPEETTVEDPVGSGVARPVGEVEEVDPTREELYEKASRMGIRGRSKMTKDELAAAIREPANRKAWRRQQKHEGRA